MRKLSLVFAFLSLTNCVIGQAFTVSGYVRDSDNGEALMGATVSHENGKNGTSANQAGFWSLRVSGGHFSFKASHIGYGGEEVAVEVRSDTVLNFQMSKAAFTLERVVVKPHNESVSVTGAGQIGVNISQVRYAPAFLGEPDIIKYLQIMPGVSSGKEGSSQLLVRGGAADQTLMMLDDIPIFNNNHAFGLVSVFNADALSGVELYKGYVPARYGGRLSSVASLRMRDGNKNRHTGTITLGTLTLGGLMEGPINKGKGSYIVSARRFTPDLLLRPAYAIIKPGLRLLYSFYDVNGKINYQLGERNRIYLSVYNGGDSFSNRTMDYEGKELSSKSGINFRWGNTSASLKLETRAGKDIFINNSVYYTQIGNRYGSIYKDYDNGEDFTYRNFSDLFETGIRSTVEQKAGHSHSLTYGLHAYYQGFNPQHTVQTKDGVSLERDFARRSLWTGSLFIDDRISLGRITVDLGLRASAFYNNSKLEFGLEPRAAAHLQVNPKNTASLAYTRSVQPLFSIIKPYMGFPLDFWLPYDTEKISSANQISIGWTNRDIPGLTLSLETYYKNFQDLTLILSSDDYLNGETGALPADGYAYGIEFLGVYSFDRWSVSGAYTYSRSMRSAEGRTFPFSYDVPHSANIFASYVTLLKNNRKHILSVNMNCRSGLPFILSNGSYSIYGEDEGDGWQYIDYIEDNPKFPNARLKPYFRTDISYSMERKKRNGTRTWQISILNVTATSNPYVVYGTKGHYEYMELIPIMPSFSYKRTF